MPCWCLITGFKLKLVRGQVRLGLGFEVELVNRQVRFDLAFEAEAVNRQALFFRLLINLKEGFRMSKLLENILIVRERTHKFRVLE